VSHNILDSSGFTQVYLRLDFREGLNLADYQFLYGLANEYNPETVSYIDLDLAQNTIYEGQNSRILKLSFPATQNIPILIIKVSNMEEKLDSYSDITLKSPFLFDRSDLSIWVNGGDELLFTNYLTINDSVVIKSSNPKMGSAQAYYYQHEFPAADPPVSSGPGAGKKLEIDSVLSLPLDQSLVLSRPGLYFIQTDTASLSGISVLVGHPAFPKAQTIDDLIDPLIYVSTKQETQRLRNAPEKKKALDKYLMDLTRSKDRAKLFVRHYFKRVVESNQIFTNYKEGWKTDKGMVYILMGIPDVVTPVDDRELWTYNLPSGEVTFNFVRVKSIFSAHHHHLLRDKSYDRIWFGVVDQWRKGKFRF